MLRYTPDLLSDRYDADAQMHVRARNLLFLNQPFNAF